MNILDELDYFINQTCIKDPLLVGL